ncbi:MAG: hypothetical protein WBK79_01900, partial [Candidatus Cloacimonas acidaminovorans]
FELQQQALIAGRKKYGCNSKKKEQRFCDLKPVFFAKKAIHTCSIFFTCLRFTSSAQRPVLSYSSNSRNEEQRHL